MILAFALTLLAGCVNGQPADPHGRHVNHENHEKLGL
jgi:hypothetical protein